MSERRRVAITGMGVVSCLGLDIESFWSSIMAGKCGIKPITEIDVSEYRTPYGGIVDDGALTNALGKLGIRGSERAIDMALVAAHEALTGAGQVCGGGEYEPLEMATVVGTAVGSTHAVYSSHKSLHENGLRGVRPTAVPRCMANAVSAQVSMRYRLTGPNYVMVSACSSSTLALGTAFRMVRDGYIDRALCCGTDAVFDPGTYAGWEKLGVMSRNPVPEKACRPFDAGRDGCVLGEGAGSVVLEPLEVAERRGARVMAEIAGYGESSDAGHITRPSAEGQARAIRAALRDAGIGAEDIDFINAHGTATRANDACECESIRLALGEHADRIPVASNKSFFGHMLGGSGVVEVIVAVLGMMRGAMPGNLNLERPDPECDLKFAGAGPVDGAVRTVMKNSFGFGGHNGVVVVRKKG